MGTIRDRILETQQTLKRSRRDEKNRWKNCTKRFNEPDYYDGMVSHPEPDFLECEVKWALASTAVSKVSGCDEIPVELFRTLKDDAIKVLHSICQQIWKTRQWPQDWKRSILIPVPKKGRTKECADHWTIHSSHMLVRSCLKSCMLGFSILKTKNFQISNLGLEKEEEPEIRLPTFTGSQKKKENSRKASTFVSLTMLKLLGVRQDGRVKGRELIFSCKNTKISTSC